MENVKKTLFDFLSMPLHNGDEVFEKFASLKGAVYHKSGKTNERFVFVEGTRENRVVLVAHADTVQHYQKNHIVYEDNGCYFSKDEKGSPNILGADDRAGCAILWLLRNSGHSLLILDGEEVGMVGSSYLVHNHPEIADKLNNEHQFMVQFDRRGSKDFKTYQVGSKDFDKYVADKTGYVMPDRYSFTDIVTLCTSVCGVNLSVGYYNEHTRNEFVNIKEWQNTLNIAENWLNDLELPRFVQDVKTYEKYEDVYSSVYDEYYSYMRKNRKDTKKSLKSLKSWDYNDDYDDFEEWDTYVEPKVKTSKSFKFSEPHRLSTPFDDIQGCFEQEFLDDGDDEEDYEDEFESYQTDEEYYLENFETVNFLEPFWNGVKLSKMILKLKIQKYFNKFKKVKK